MKFFFILFSFLSMTLILMALRLKPRVWITFLAISLIALSPTISSYPFLLSILWLCFLLAVLLTLSSKIRCFLITRPIFNKLSKTLTPMSLTERQAIEAGGSWWERYLFSGAPDFEVFKQIPLPSLTSEEQAFLEGPTETLCHFLNDWEINQAQDLPGEIWQFLRDHRFFGLVIHKDWGGLGFSAMAHSTIVMKIASRSLSAAITAMVPNSLGPGELIQRYGTEMQKQYYLPRLAQGIEIPCFGLTSLEAGSDATALIDHGVICKAKNQEGVETIYIRLNWDKRYITLAPVATLIGLAFKLYDPDHLLSPKTDLGITLALVPAKHPGVEIGARHKPMHMGFMNGPTRGRDVLIPVDWIIGGIAYIGQGWKMMMECLSDGRGISLPALATGNAKMSCVMASAYAYLRKQFHVSIGEFEGIQAVLARMTGMAYLCESIRCFTVSAVDSGVQPSLASAISKYHLTELGRKIGNDALDVYGGRAIQRGPRNYMASLYDAIPISITVEGANILTRSLIIFGQGVVRCHPYLQQEMAAIEEKSLAKFDELLFQHAGFFLQNLAKTFWLNLGVHRWLSVPFEGRHRYPAQQIQRMSQALAFLSDVALMRFGGALKRKEVLSARMGDILSHLYMASALLKHDVGQDASEQPPNPCFQWAMAYCFHQIQIALEGFLENLRSPLLRGLLNILIFPFGKIYSAPFDQLNKDIVSEMMKDSWLRKKMRQYCFISDIEDDAVGRVDSAFRACLQTEPWRKQVENAIRDKKIKETIHFEQQIAQAVQASMLTQSAADACLDAEKKRLDSLEVDEF